MGKRWVVHLLVVCASVGFILAVGGCVAGTARYYMPLVAQRFSPKADDAILPIFEDTPKRPFLVIGKLAFETKRDLRFIYKSLQYNARKNGADAIILRSLTSRKREWMDYTPSWIGSKRDLDWVTHDDGSMSLEWLDRPVLHPGSSIPREQTLRSVQAEIIVFQ